MGIEKKRLNVTVLLSTQNVFKLMDKKFMLKYFAYMDLAMNIVL